MAKIEDNQPEPWIGVDLDGTLAYWDGWHGPLHIGEPIPRMVNRVKAWLAAGKTVKIMTARACDPTPGTIETIQKWCKKHLGQVLEVTNAKDYNMEELWDDRAVGVVHNTGKMVGDLWPELDDEYTP